MERATIWELKLTVLALRTIADGTLGTTCAATSDHHLLAGSACIDTGTTSGAPAHEIGADCL